MSELGFPYRIDARGRTASASDHVRDLIEQVLMTAPGERVNRPTFGSGLMQLAFAPNSDALAAATLVSVQSSLQQWLGTLIQVEGVDVDREDAALIITVRYAVRRTGERRVDQFSRPL